MDLNKSIVELYKKSKLANETAPKKDEAADLKKKRLRLEELAYRPKITFDKLYGCESARDRLINIVEDFKRFNREVEKSWPFLICGSRGLGKTSIVEATANYADMKLLRLSMKSIIKDSRQFDTILKFFTSQCIAEQPAVILVDDIEQLKDREDLRDLLREAVNRLLEDDSKLLVFCTTASFVDESSGPNFLATIHLKRPDTQARFKILQSIRDNSTYLDKISDDNLNLLATSTPSFTALDLMKMFRVARIESNGKPDIVDCNKAVDFVKQTFERSSHLIGEKPSVTWSDIGGLTEVRRQFIDILRQIKKGDATCKFAGIALYGPPGCGKTMVAKAMANEGGFNFISIKPAELVNKFLGETEKNIRRVFSEAQEYEPCMIYFDEFDGLCGTRGNRETVTSAIHTLLSEMDGFASRGKSIILASTNRLEDIDPAMKRPGRLSKHIFLGPPNGEARLDILKVITNRCQVPLSSEIDLNFWAAKTENFSGADLDYLISEAESHARIERGELESDNLEIRKIDFEAAMEAIRATNRELFKKIKI